MDILCRHRGLKDNCIPKSFMHKVPWRKGSRVLCLTTQSASPHITTHQRSHTESTFRNLPMWKIYDSRFEIHLRCNAGNQALLTPTLTKLHVKKGNLTACSSRGNFSAAQSSVTSGRVSPCATPAAVWATSLLTLNETRVCSILPSAQKTLNN